MKFSGRHSTDIVCSLILNENVRAKYPQDSWKVGDVVTYQCDVGYEFVGFPETVASCGKDERWSAPSPNCKKVRCPVIQFENMAGMYPRNEYDDRVFVRCKSGYLLRGTQTLICQSNRKWNQALPTCESTPCQPPVLPDRAYISNEREEFLPLTKVNIQCVDGYILTGNVTILTCEGTGRWSDTDAACKGQRPCASNPCKHGGTCRESGQRYICDCTRDYTGTTCAAEKTCRTPNPTYTYITEVSGERPTYQLTYRRHQNITFSCRDRTRVIAGQSTITCLPTGQWDSSAPDTCVRHCPMPDAPNNGHWSDLGSKRTFYVGDTLQFLCNRGFRFSGSVDTVVCQSSGAWGRINEFCADETACDPNPCQFGGICTPTQSGHSCTCRAGFTGVNCEKEITCGRLVPGGHQQLSNDQDTWRVGDRVTYVCDAGYVFGGSATAARRCNEDGLWSGTQPVCIGVSCGIPPVVENEYRRTEPTEVHRYNDVFTYARCKRGYYFEGQSKITCQEDGSWTPHPVCKEIQECAEVEAPEHATMQKIKRNRRKFACDESLYELEGEKVITCHGNGTWSAPAPLCKVIPPTEKTTYEGIEYLVYAQPFMRSNFTNAKKMCASIGANLAVLYTHRVRQNLERTLGKLTAERVHLYIGLQRINTPRIAPTTRFEWITDDIPTQLPSTWNKADRQMHWKSGYPKSGGSDCGVIYKESQRFRQHTYRWQNLNCAKKRFLVCQRNYRPCVRNPRKHGGTCRERGQRYICDCTMEYTGTTCVAEKICRKPYTRNTYIMEINGERPTNQLTYRRHQNITFSCRDRTRVISGQSTITCLPTGQWDSSVPDTCEFAKCGQAGDVGNIEEQATSLARVIGGESAANTAWPWQALITQKGLTLAQTFHRKATLGGGSLLNNNWVLTAAHVFMFEFPGWESGIVVSLGISQRPIDGEMTKSHRMFLIGEYFQHGGFNLWTFENDIALIKLGSQLDSAMTIIDGRNGAGYGFYFRPVCLPCTGTCLRKDQLTDDEGNSLVNDQMTEQEMCQREEELLLAKDAKVVLTGFGYVNRRLEGEKLENKHYHLPHQLQQGLLQIQDFETCGENMEEIKANYPGNRKVQNLTFSDNFICCRSGKNDSTVDACKGDSGGPVIRQVVDLETNESCWIQIGIVSFGLGCGDPRYAGFYTNVANYVDWIKQMIADSTTVAVGRQTVTCPPPQKIKNADETPDRVFKYNETYTYKCSEYYRISRIATLECMINGQWSREPPTCDLIECKTPPERDNLTLITIGQPGPWLPNHKATFRCSEGYTLIGGPKLSCKDNGDWSEDIPSCVETVCAAPTTDPNLILSPEQATWKPGDEVTFRCSDTYSLDGPSETTCSRQGTWDVGFPRCLASNICHLQSLIEPEGWEVENSTRTEFNIDETVELSCTGQKVSVTRNTGTFAKPIFVCQSGGIWTRAEPETDFECVRLGCPLDPQSPPNSRWYDARQGRNSAVGDRVHFSCKLGFSSVDESKYLVCQGDGTWSNNAGCEEWTATLTTSYDNIEYLVYLDEAHESSYTDAQQFCLSIGANLAVIYDDVVWHVLVGPFQQIEALSMDVYIGLAKPAWGSWRWDTTGVASLGIGHSLVTPFMGWDVPEQRCATTFLRCWYDLIYHPPRCGLYLSNVDCGTTRPFLCQRRK